MNNFYNKDLKEFARELRNETVSKAEKYLWKAGLSRGKMGVKFKRQRPIDNFIVDFFSAEVNLIIEIDGNSHVNKGNYDRSREDKLEELGYTLLRFNEGDVLNNFPEVDGAIRHAIYCLKEKRDWNDALSYPPP
jgi:very-short-patch-repair endonuclease